MLILAGYFLFDVPMDLEPFVVFVVVDFSGKEEDLKHIDLVN